MDFLQYTAGPDDTGRRLDKIIRKFLPETPMSEIFKYLRKGFIKLNGRKVEGSIHVDAGDVIQIAAFAVQNKTEGDVKANPCSLENEEQPYSTSLSLEDVFRNRYLRILNKPYDVPVHGKSDSGISLEEAVRKDYSPQENSLSFTPGPLHRIDRKTTGLVVFSQNLIGAKLFSEMMQEHRFTKKYLAVLRGTLREKAIWQDQIDDKPIAESPTTRKNTTSFHTVKIVKSGGKTAVSKITPISHGVFQETPITLAEVQIETGRKHQIRAQCAFHGHPLLGDTAYGSPDYRTLQGHFLLHSWEMTFPEHNPLDLPPRVIAPLPIFLTDFIENYLPAVDVSNYNL